jgi:hypothetical protein
MEPPENRARKSTELVSTPHLQNKEISLALSALTFFDLKDQNSVKILSGLKT